MKKVSSRLDYLGYGTYKFSWDKELYHYFPSFLKYSLSEITKSCILVGYTAAVCIYSHATQDKIHIYLCSC